MSRPPVQAAEPGAGSGAADTGLTVLAQVAEQMGFLTALGRAAEPPAGPARMVLTVTFTGPSAGVVALAGSTALAEALARNLLAIDPDAAVPPDDARDALAEFANVVAGNLLPALLGDGEFHLAAPVVGPWPPGSPAVACLECAEGVVAVAVVVSR